MNEKQIKRAMEQVSMKTEMREEIIMNVKKKMENQTGKRTGFRRTAFTAAACALAFIAVSVPSYAAIKSLVLERMETVPETEMEAVADMLQNQKDVQADLFSREYTQEERERMKGLYEEYANGKFPESTLLLAESEEEVSGDTIVYSKDTGRFFLPERELTDEELLQIIDFNMARNYAIERQQAQE